MLCLFTADRLRDFVAAIFMTRLDPSHVLPAEVTRSVGVNDHTIRELTDSAA